MDRDDQSRSQSDNCPELLISSSRDFFQEAVKHACEQRKIKTYPLVKSYLVQLLEYYMAADRLFDEVDSSGRKQSETLAEMFLKASSAEPGTRTRLLKKIGDQSLYVSGFFGDSLHGKVVDFEYYAGIGGAAYGALSGSVRKSDAANVYKEFAQRFGDFVEVLTYISMHAFSRSEENILRLYESYTQTGSTLARERLMEKGLIAVPPENLSKSKQ